MQDRLEVSLLLDIYRDLLTEKQNSVMTLYYDENYSLGEIAELNSSSRQAIFDLIRRSEGQLMKFEEKLNIMKRQDQAEKRKEDLIRMLEDEKKLTPVIRKMIDEI